MGFQCQVFVPLIHDIYVCFGVRGSQGSVTLFFFRNSRAHYTRGYCKKLFLSLPSLIFWPSIHGHTWASWKKQLQWPSHWGWGGVTWVSICWQCATGISDVGYRIMVCLWSILWAIIDPHHTHSWPNDLLTRNVSKTFEPILRTLVKMTKKATPL